MGKGVKLSIKFSERVERTMRFSIKFTSGIANRTIIAGVERGCRNGG